MWILGLRDHGLSALRSILEAGWKRRIFVDLHAVLAFVLPGVNSRRTFLCAVGVAMMAACVFFAYLGRPGLGDDFTYWKTGFNTAMGNEDAWRPTSFHDLRWPVWGMVHLYTRIFGPGLVPFYAVPLTYLIAGSLLAFFIGRHVAGGEAAGFTAALLFTMHPLLDSVVHRPMPDLSEGVWGAGAILCWLAAMRDGPAWRRVLAAVACGLLVAVAHSNRFTGILLMPGLAVLTLFFFPKRLPWLLLCVGSAAAFIGVECAIYYGITGDPLHSLHTNMGAKGRKGTDAVSVFYLPFRFLDTLWKASRLAPFYCLLGVAGAWWAWTRSSPLGKVLVGWLVVGYLGYACALQQLWPPRPMLRDADRFLGALAIPMAVLAVCGLKALGAWLAAVPQERVRACAGALSERPAVLFAILAGVLCAATKRDTFNMGHVGELQGYIRSRPPGTKVFTHRGMWEYAHLVDHRAASRLIFDAGRKPGSIPESGFIEKQPDRERWAEAADEIWFCRKLTWLRLRKEAFNRTREAAPPLASYLDHPEERWRFAKLIALDRNPEFVFYQRRKVSDTVPVRVVAGEIGVGLPVSWDGEKREYTHTVRISETWQGKRARVRIECASDISQAVELKLAFRADLRALLTVNAKPTFFPGGGVDFFNLEIPEDAEEAVLSAKVVKGVTALSLSSLELVIE